MTSKVPSDPNMTPEVRRFLDDLDRKNSFSNLTVDSLTVNELASFLLGLTVAAGGIAITAGGLTVTAGGLTVTAGSVSFPAGSISNSALATPPIFSKSFTSSQQTITSGGALTLAHSLGTTPTLVQCRLKNTTAELGYSIGDEVLFGLPGVSVTNVSIAVVPDATNINIRFGSAGTVFVLLNKGSGAAATATNANWKLIVSAWA